jgi:branched-chain amino acid transport system permease protein
MTVYEIAQQTINGIALGGTYALLALGLAVVFSILKMINFAHGELMTVGGYALFGVLAAGMPLAMAMIAALLASVVLAVLMERIAFRPFRNYGGATLLISSFAVSSLIQVALENFFSPRPRAIALPAILSEAVSFGALSVGILQIISIVVTLCVLAALVIFLKRTVMGLAMRAAADDFDVTNLMGIRANGVISVTFAISGFLAGIAGLLWIAQRSSVDPTMGSFPVLQSFIAVILGGLRSPVGAVIGGFVLGLAEVYLQAFLPASIEQYREAFALLLVVGILVRWPDGLQSIRLRRSSVDA